MDDRLLPRLKKIKIKTNKSHRKITTKHSLLEQSRKYYLKTD